MYWGSHGCSLPRGHEGPHLCDCAFGDDGSMDPRADAVEESVNVGAPPYYGPETVFYGEDVLS